MRNYAKTVSLVTGLVGFAAFAGNHWYVDAVNGDDRWDGKVAFSAVDQNANAGPKKTFANLFADCQIQSDDVVHAAAGTYSNLTMTATSGIKGEYRLIVPAGVTVVADEGPEKTIIRGDSATGVSLSESPFGCGESAVRCVQLKGTGATIKGFTLTGGRSSSYTGSGAQYYVGAVDGSPATVRETYVVGCVITNNVGNRAAGVYKSIAVRCYFADNRVTQTGCDVMEGGAFNCVFGDCLNDSSYNVYGGAQYSYVNNTFYGRGYCAAGVKGAPRTLYNCVVLKSPSSYTYFTNCIVAATGGTIGEGSQRLNDIADMKLGGDLRPLRDSLCMNSGEYSYYDDNFPAAIADEKGLCFGKNKRVYGDVIDIGAVESPFVAGTSFDWYVDAINGLDANDGYSNATAFQNLSMALTNSCLRSGDTIHAASGVYSNGIVTSKWKFRAVVPAGVMLVGEDGADKTFIIGERDESVEVNQAPYGCGENAVRCVRLMEGSRLQGFTVTGGFAPSCAGNDAGGGVYCGDDNINAKPYGLVLNCVITNNCASFGSGAYGGIFIGCNFSNNRAGTESRGSDVHSGRAYNCLFGDALGTCNYMGVHAVNCTFYGAGSASYQSGSSYVENIINCVLLKEAGRHVRLINSATISAQSTLGDGSVLLGQEEMMIDENFQLQKGSKLIDKGSQELYQAYLAQDEAYFTQDGLTNLDKDILGNNRIYNRAIDMGAFEYDWRGDFAATVGKHNLTVVTASENVAVSGTSELQIPSENSITLEWNLQDKGTYSFKILQFGDDVTVLRDGVEISANSDGVYQFAHNGDSTITTIVISCDKSSSALISSFRKVKGLLLVVQ